MEADYEDSEIPVNFLTEVRVPCLICGADVEINNIIKQEVSELDERSENVREYLDGVKDNIDHNVFHWFLKWFRVDIVKKGKQRLVNRGWDGHGGDILRFCGNCKMELMGILELQNQLDELEERIKRRLGEVKEKMERGEEDVRCTGIYERDQRYKRVRSKIVKCVAGNSSHSRSDNYQSSSVRPLEDLPSRRSSRRKMDYVEESDPFLYAAIANDEDDEPLEAKVPVVMLSSLDKVSADQYLIPGLPDEDVKPDILSSTESTEISDLNTPVIKVKPTIQRIEKASIRKIRKLKKKTDKKLTLKKSKIPKKTANLEDDWDTNFLEDDSHDNQSDPDLDQDNQSSRPRRKRKAKDQDFVSPDDALSSDEDKDDIDWNTKSEGKRKWNYKLDPSTNTISFGTNSFSISSDDPNKVTCTPCNITMKNHKPCMISHITKYHTNRFVCPQCPFRATGRNILKIHIQGVHEGLPVSRKFPCKICGKLIGKRKNHEWTHMNKEEQDYILKNEPHRLPEWLSKKWQCDECGRSFIGQGDLKKHQENTHEGKGVDKQKELCPECGRAVVDLKGHLKMSHGESGKFECTEQGCGKRFKILSLLTRHKNDVHRRIRDWKCTLCTREFSRESRLKKHMDLHLGIRPWKCEVEGCGGAFATKGNLRKHWKCFHEEGSKPRRKSYQRGPTVLGVGFRKDELVKNGTYYPPSALSGWAMGRVPGHLMGEGMGEEGEERDRVQMDEMQQCLK